MDSYSRRMGFAPLAPKALFGSVLPGSVVGLSSVIYRTRQYKYVVIFPFTVIRYKSCCYPQGFNFFLQPGHLKLFLSQNFVNVSHAQAPSRAQQRLRIAGLRATNPVTRNFASGQFEFPQSSATKRPVGNCGAWRTVRNSCRRTAK